MSLENIRGVIRKIDYTLTEDEIDDWCEACRYAIQTETYDFSSFSRKVYSQSGKKRVIYSFPKLSVENMLSHYLKQQLDRAFHIKYASRSKIINLLFNTLVATKNMNDFVIVRADFKSFFDSVKSEYVYEKYILPSIIKREDKQLLEKYVENFKYCYAGLCLSNGMTEIVCKDFDIVLKARLTGNGVQSMPMWAHYANNHKGFCVAYDVKDSMDLKSCLFPVQYTNQRLDISSEMVRQVQKLVKSIDETHQKGNLVTMLEDETLIYLPQLLYNIKHSSWSYEKEYRCIIASTANGMPFIDAKPKAIYIGRDCSDKNADCLFDIADEHEVKIYKMGFDDCVDSYELYYYEFYK